MVSFMCWLLSRIMGLSLVLFKKLKSINSYIFVVLLLVWFIVAVMTWCKLILCDWMWKCQLI